MNNAFRMSGIERIGNFNRQAERDVGFDRPSRNAMLQRQAFEEFHRYERLAILLANVINSANVWMVQRGS